MFRFNGTEKELKAVECTFKYILCFGSTNRIAFKKRTDIKFKYILCFGSTIGVGPKGMAELHLNTSYVSVQHVFVLLPTCSLIDLNTSYVSVQRRQITDDYTLTIFKYIPCFGSTWLIRWQCKVI